MSTFRQYTGDRPIDDFSADVTNRFDNLPNVTQQKTVTTKVTAAGSVQVSHGLVSFSGAVVIMTTATSSPSSHISAGNTQNSFTFTTDQPGTYTFLVM